MKETFTAHGIEKQESLDTSEDLLVLQDLIYAKDELYDDLHRGLTDAEKKHFSTFYGATPYGAGVEV